MACMEPTSIHAQLSGHVQQSVPSSHPFKNLEPQTATTEFSSSGVFLESLSFMFVRIRIYAIDRRQVPHWLHSGTPSASQSSVRTLSSHTQRKRTQGMVSRAGMLCGVLCGWPFRAHRLLHGNTFSQHTVLCTALCTVHMPCAAPSIAIDCHTYFLLSRILLSSSPGSARGLPATGSGGSTH